jgi:hypothetical protein
MMNINILGRENFHSNIHYGEFVCVYCSGVPSGLNKRKYFFFHFINYMMNGLILMSAA